MATDLERLVISLSADIKSYENALRKAGVQTNRAAAQIENRFNRMNKSIQASFGGLDRSVKAFAAGFVGAFGVQQLTQLARAAAEAGDAIGDLADQTGATTDSIQILRYAAQQTGASAEQMDAAIAKLAVNLGEAQRGSGDLAKLLKANGVALKDATGKARPFNDILNDIIELVRRAPDQFSKLEVVTTAFGAKNDELVTTFAAGVDGVDAYGRALQDLGGIIDQDGIDALGRLDAKFNETMVSMEAATKRLVVAIGPMIESVLEEIVQFANQLGEIADTVNLLLKGEFAAAGRLASQGRETASQTLQREIDEIGARRAALEANIAQQQKMFPDEGVPQKMLDQREKLIEQERDLVQRQRAVLELRKDIDQRVGGLPGAPTVIPPAAAGTKATGGGGATTTTDRDSGMTTIATAGGLKATVAAAYAEQFEGFLRELEASGYLITSLGGYNYRNIAGTDKLSQHAYGKAIDINPATNPYTKGALVTDMPAGVEDMAKRWGLAWGGAWKSVKDAMHFEADVLLGEEDLNTAISTANAIEKQYEETLDRNQANWESWLEERQASTEATVEQMDSLRDLSSDIFGGIVSDLRAGASAGEIFANVLDKIISRLADMAINSLTTALFGASGTTAPGLLGGLFGAPAIAGARASGGPVMAGSSYMVGEAGPELFVPSVGGSILPNSRSGMDVRNRVSVEPSPLFVVTVQSETRRMKRETMAEMPGYLADQQKRVSRG